MAEKRILSSLAERVREMILRQGGRATPARLHVLEILLGGSPPLSHDEIAAALELKGHSLDRVTLYRTLEWLVAQGLACRIAGSERGWRFEGVREAYRSHAHFHCDECHRISCLDDLPLDISPELPVGYRSRRAELVFHGLCPACDAAMTRRSAAS